MLREQQEKVIRTVKIGDDEYHTLDDYSNEPQLDAADDEVEKDDIWGEGNLAVFQCSRRTLVELSSGCCSRTT